MSEEGMFYGVQLGGTLRNWLPASPEQSYEAMDIAFYKIMLRGEARFAIGEVDYEAPGWGTINNVNDRTFEGRLLVGPDFPLENTLITLFTGVGYRYLHDDLRADAVDSGAYERESQYLYIPLGIETTSQLGGGWSGGVSAELDIFLWGNQRSHSTIRWGHSEDGETDEDGNDWPFDFIVDYVEDFNDNYQPRGYGLRFSARLEKKGDKVDIIIEPFFRFWEINESDVLWSYDFSYSWREPTNSTTEAGVRVMLGF